jgi:tight adherence protein B
MATILNLAGDLLWLVSLATAFGCATLLMLAAMMRGQQYMTEYKAAFTETASTSLADMFSFADPVKLFYINIAAVIAIPILVMILFGDWKLAFVVFILLLFVPNIMYSSARKRRYRKFEQQLPDGLAMISGSMRAGASLTIALESLVKEQQPPLAQEFQLFLREQRIGVDFEDSLAHMEKRMPIPDLGMVISALRISREVGGNLAEVLESVAGHRHDRAANSARRVAQFPRTRSDGEIVDDAGRMGRTRRDPRHARARLFHDLQNHND